MSLEVPCGLAKERLVNWGNELTDLVAPPASIEECVCVLVLRL
jgi:hypothetical protein